jgi:Tfp pilus assembly protein PilV
MTSPILYAAPRAFTLVETLVAISILMIAITGPLYSIHKALMTTYVARDELVATGLAQEGVEYVRNIRDGNYIYNLQNPGTPQSWLYGLDNCRSGKTCVVDATGNTPITTCTGTCSALTLSTGSVPVYSQAPGQASRFTRSVTITDVPGSTTEVIVTVNVSWITNGTTYSTNVVEHLNSWL